MSAQYPSRRYLIFTAVIAAIVFAALLAADLLRDREKFTLDEADRYFTFDFEPRYRRADCIVRIDVELRFDPSDDPISTLFYAFSGYLRKNAPKSAFFQFQVQDRDEPETASMYLIFADDCERRFEISRAMVNAVMGYHPAFELRVVPERYEPGPQTIDENDELWIDSPYYDPEEWVLRKAAFRGDTESLLIIAKRNDPKTDDHTQSEVAYIFYFLAAKRLPPGPDRSFAEQRLPIVLDMVREDLRDRAILRAREWDAAIRIYGEGAGRE